LLVEALLGLGHVLAPADQRGQSLAGNLALMEDATQLLGGGLEAGPVLLKDVGSVIPLRAHRSGFAGQLGVPGLD
jgi:hypothetical protein